MAEQDWITTERTYWPDWKAKRSGPLLTLVRMQSPFYAGERWAVRRGRCCLATDGKWEWEPSPSSRDDAFYARCRFASFDDAADAALRALEGTN